MRPKGLGDRSTPFAQAAYWFNLHLSGDMTAFEQRAFAIWLRQSPFNGLAYRALERRWARLGIVGRDPQFQAAVAAALGRRRWRRLRRLCFALAALLLLGLIMGWQTLGQNTAAVHMAAPLDRQSRAAGSATPWRIHLAGTTAVS